MKMITRNEPAQERVPFNKPFIVGKELFYISQAVMSGQLAGDGLFTKRCQTWLEENLGGRKVLLTHSCTAALEMAALLLDLGPGDEVVMPSFTFVSTASAFVMRGAVPRFVDIRPDFLNLDESLIEEAISERTRAIVPVHYAGVACEMDAIIAIAEKHDLAVVEDAAQGMLATYRGRSLGTIGNLGTYSFHETKNCISGEGGALVVNDERFVERAEILREKGTNRSKFFRGEVDKYSWVDLGSSYLPSELVAAFLLAQLEEAQIITKRRQDIFTRYLKSLHPLAEKGLLRLPRWPDYCEHNAHLFYLILNDEEIRDALQSHLRERGIHAVFHYVPLHTSKMGESFGYQPGDLPVTESISGRLLRLPFYFELEPTSQERVIAEIKTFFGQ